MLHGWKHGNKTKRACKASFPALMLAPNLEVGGGVIFMCKALVGQIENHQDVHWCESPPALLTVLSYSPALFMRYHAI